MRTAGRLHLLDSNPRRIRLLHATLRIKPDIHLAVVSKRLVHSTIGVTVDLYGHLMRGVNRDAAEAAAAILLPKDQTARTLPTQVSEK